MTTITPFTPSPLAPFQFSPVLDGVTYTCTVTWNLFRGGGGWPGWYLNINAADGTLIGCRALVASPAAIPVIAASWANQRATLTLAAAHGYPIGQTVALTVAGMTPTDYNGAVQAVVTSMTTIAYPLPTDPGTATAFGAVTYDISLTGGYFSSTLVYREGLQQFEVNP